MTGSETISNQSLQCPLLAVSGPSKRLVFGRLNVRFGEKRTLSPRLPKLNRKPSALPSEADIQLILVKGSANDPKRTWKHRLSGTRSTTCSTTPAQVSGSGCQARASPKVMETACNHFRLTATICKRKRMPKCHALAFLPSASKHKGSM